MSVIRKQPFIEKELNKLDKEQLVYLKEVLNTTSPNIANYGFGNLPEEEITVCRFEFAKGDCKQGILINTDTTQFFIQYNRYQTLALYKLDLTNYKYEEIKEYCDINELRRVLNDAAYDGGEGEGLTPQTLHNVLEGSDDIIADLNETATKVQVRLDEVFKGQLLYRDSLVDSETIVVDEQEDGTFDFNLQTEVKNKIDKALVVPMTAPANTKIVGINSANAQVNIGIGEGLTLDGGMLKLDLEQAESEAY